MNARELRIGNYFQWKEHASMGSGVAQITHGQQIMDYLDFKEGIPLTAEWLERFGFEKDESDPDILFYNKGPIAFNCWEDHSEFWPRFTSSASKYKYVHQLQNLYFALTGEELTIVNPTETHQ